MRRASLVSSVVAAAGLSACVNGPIDPVELIATDVAIDAERPEMSRLPDGTIAQRYIVVLRNDLLLEGYAPALVTELVIDNDIRMERVYQHALGGFAATLTPAQKATLEAREDVAFVVPDMPVHAINNGNGNGNLPEVQARPGTQAPPAADWALNDVLGAAYASSVGGNGVTVSVLDTGVDSDHPSLPSAVGCLGDFTSEATGSCEDVQGHGTHVTGSIAAIQTTTTAGIVRGIAPNVTLRPGRVLGATGSGSNAGIAAGIDAAAGANSDVINMSLGGAAFGSEATDALCVAINNAANAGTLSVVAAGNDGRDAEGFSPSRCDNAFTIGAYDVNGKLASFTNYGPGVDINGPGVNIASTAIGGQFAWSSGTSMASPHAAAVAALYLQDNPGSTPAQIVAGVVANSLDRGAPSKYSNRITSTKPKLDGRDY